MSAKPAAQPAGTKCSQAARERRVDPEDGTEYSSFEEFCHLSRRGVLEDDAPPLTYLRISRSLCDLFSFESKPVCDVKSFNDIECTNLRTPVSSCRGDLCQHTRIASDHSMKVCSPM